MQKTEAIKTEKKNNDISWDALTTDFAARLQNPDYRMEPSEYAAWWYQPKTIGVWTMCCAKMGQLRTL